MPNREHSSLIAVPGRETSRWRRIGPIVALLLLAPVIAEVLFGSTRLSVILVLIPEILTWGCGALLIRECVRRWRKGWQSMLLLGLALAVAEEWVIQQTSISPLVSLGQHGYGRVWGVNWVYFLWALGYESVWVVLVPVQLVELIFQDRREELWLRARGLVFVSMAFLLGACMAWYGWTQRARVKIFHMQPYSPSALCLLIGLGSILLLILAAYALPSGRPQGGDSASRSAPPPWAVGAAIFALGAAWAVFVELGWGVGSLPGAPVGFVLASGIAWVALTFFLVRRWTFSVDWNDAHRFALVFGAVVACVLGGFVDYKIGGALRIDWIGKFVFNAAAVAWLVWFRRNVARRT
ncbi:MAG: hypothetical protein WBF06_13280 [Candidatus Acidiferrales bacterium]